VAESQVSQTVVATIPELVRPTRSTVLLIINAFLLLIGCIVEPLPAMTFSSRPGPAGAEPASTRSSWRRGGPEPDDRPHAIRPIGLLLFVVSSVGKIRIAAVMWEILPFLAWALIVLVLTIVFPP